MRYFAEKSTGTCEHMDETELITNLKQDFNILALTWELICFIELDK